MVRAGRTVKEAARVGFQDDEMITGKTTRWPRRLNLQEEVGAHEGRWITRREGSSPQFDGHYPVDGHIERHPCSDILRYSAIPGYECRQRSLRRDDSTDRHLDPSQDGLCITPAKLLSKDSRSYIEGPAVRVI